MRYTERYRVKPGSKVRLDDWDARDTADAPKKSQGRTQLHKNVEALSDLQHLFYADGRHALLIVLQGMDAAGKDGTIRHVMGGLNPQGCRVHSFKQPTARELRQDFLWRIHQDVPPAGIIGIFNRSHDEDVQNRNSMCRELYSRIS